jgi:hypothetical protein
LRQALRDAIRIVSSKVAATATLTPAREAGSGALTLGVPSSAGVPPEVTAQTVVLVSTILLVSSDF